MTGKPYRLKPNKNEGLRCSICWGTAASAKHVSVSSVQSKRQRVRNTEMTTLARGGRHCSSCRATFVSMPPHNPNIIVIILAAVMLQMTSAQFQSTVSDQPWKEWIWGSDHALVGVYAWSGAADWDSNRLWMQNHIGMLIVHSFSFWTCFLSNSVTSRYCGNPRTFFSFFMSWQYRGSWPTSCELLA